MISVVQIRQPELRETRRLSHQLRAATETNSICKPKSTLLGPRGTSSAEIESLPVSLPGLSCHSRAVTAQHCREPEWREFPTGFLWGRPQSLHPLFLGHFSDSDGA